MIKKKGFTLIELMAVIAIIAILAAVLVPTVSGYIKRAKVTALEEDLREITNASFVMYQSIGRYAQGSGSFFSKNNNGDLVINGGIKDDDPIIEFVENLEIPYGGTYYLQDNHEQKIAVLTVYADNKLSKGEISKLKDDFGDSISFFSENIFEVVIARYN